MVYADNANTLQSSKILNNSGLSKFLTKKVIDNPYRAHIHLHRHEVRHQGQKNAIRVPLLPFAERHFCISDHFWTRFSPYQHWSLYNICTIVVQYLYNCKRTNIVQVLYIYCTTTGVDPLKHWKWSVFKTQFFPFCIFFKIFCYF